MLLNFIFIAKLLVILDIYPSFTCYLSLKSCHTFIFDLIQLSVQFVSPDTFAGRCADVSPLMFLEVVDAQTDICCLYLNVPSH